MGSKIKNIITNQHAPAALPSISLEFHSKMLPKKNSITLAKAAVRHGGPSAT